MRKTDYIILDKNGSADNNSYLVECDVAAKDGYNLNAVLALAKEYKEILSGKMGE